MAKLIKEMDQVKEHNEKLKNTLQLQMKETDRLKVCHQFVVKLKLNCRDEKLNLMLLLLARRRW